MATSLHPDLALLYSFFQTQRAAMPSAFAHGRSIIPTPSFFSMQQLQQHLSNPLLQPEWVNLVKNGQYLPVADSLVWKTIQTKRMTFLDKEWMNSAIKSGAAVVLEGLDIMDPAINAFNAAIDDLHPCVLSNCVAFFSQCGHEAYRGHCDSDDVLVVQIAGQKTWEIFAPQQRRHLNNGPLSRAQMEPVLATVVMNPGDALYVRAGVPHLVGTSGSHSLHLSFDLCDRTPNVEQISALLNTRYNAACEPPYAATKEVIRRYAEMLEDPAFESILAHETTVVRSQAQRFRARIGNSTKITALTNFFR